VGIASLGLYAGAGQAGFDGYRGYQNPYLPAPQVQHQHGFKQQLEDFDRRMDGQLQRILKGMEQGKLTMNEAITLLQEHQEINALQRQYLEDGRLGHRELFDLDHRLDQASRNIMFEKRDDERLGFYGRHEGWRR
jgi:hydroxyacyl-ACP dehydratase HTD2-like protein with hotdog domain